jgi:hypothetical protein
VPKLSPIANKRLNCVLSCTEETSLRNHQAKSVEDARLHATLLAKLLTHINNDRVGNAKISKREIQVELYRGGGIMAVLKIKLSNQLNFERLEIVAPDGKKLRHFV